MANNNRNKRNNTQASQDPTKDHHGSTAEETRALNETFKAFSEQYYKPDEAKERRERIKFRIEIALAIGVALNIALTFCLLIANAIQTRYSGQQADIADRQMRISNRAYVTSTEFQLINYGGKVNDHVRWQVGPIIANTGGTSTRYLKVRSGTASIENTNNWQFKYLDREDFQSGVIAPHAYIIGGKFDFAANSPIPGKVVAGGIAKYRDVFDAPHLTECLVLERAYRLGNLPYGPAYPYNRLGHSKLYRPQLRGRRMWRGLDGPRQCNKVTRSVGATHTRCGAA